MNLRKYIGLYQIGHSDKKYYDKRNGKIIDRKRLHSNYTKTNVFFVKGVKNITRSVRSDNIFYVSVISPSGIMNTCEVEYDMEDKMFLPSRYEPSKVIQHILKQDKYIAYLMSVGYDVIKDDYYEVCNDIAINSMRDEYTIDLQNYRANHGSDTTLETKNEWNGSINQIENVGLINQWNQLHANMRAAERANRDIDRYIKETDVNNDNENSSNVNDSNVDDFNVNNGNKNNSNVNNGNKNNSNVNDSNVDDFNDSNVDDFNDSNVDDFNDSNVDDDDDSNVDDSNVDDDDDDDPEPEECDIQDDMEMPVYNRDFFTKRVRRIRKVRERTASEKSIDDIIEQVRKENADKYVFGEGWAHRTAVARLVEKKYDLDWSLEGIKQISRDDNLKYEPYVIDFSLVLSCHDDHSFTIEKRQFNNSRIVSGYVSLTKKHLHVEKTYTELHKDTYTELVY